jgi:hypothetical protein
MTRAAFLVLLFLVLPAHAEDTDCAGCMTASEIAAEAPDDFTDSGVGCIDDCLDPLELFTDPETVPEEYTIEQRELTVI